MSDLHNPLFEEEKEFLERKKLEYERALRGDVEHIKDQSVVVGKIALVGAGLFGGIWLITKAFSSKKRKQHARSEHEDADGSDAHHDEADHDYDFGAEYFTAGNGKRYKSKHAGTSAAASAQAFMDDSAANHESDDLGFGSTGAARTSADSANGALYQEASSFGIDDFEDDPFVDLPYDDSRRLPASHAFDNNAPAPRSSRSQIVGSVLQSFLQSDTGKVLVAQVAAVALAMVTKKVSQFFPAPKNADLATSSGYAPAESGFAPVASSVPPAYLDASTHPQSL